MRYPDTRALLIDKRNEDDEYGIVLIADIAKQVLAGNRSPDRVNLYEIMSKPVLGRSPGDGHPLLRPADAAVRHHAGPGDRCEASCSVSSATTTWCSPG
jgi:hypothetical protein